jgi:hypothetical protein
MRIIGEDGKPEIVTLNQPSSDENGVEKVLNDVTVGEYDVVMDTGPGYNSKRAEAVDAMTSLFAADPQLVQVAGDLYVRNMDFPGSDVIADRLAVNNPLAQIEKNSDVPPQAQMMIAQGKKTIQDLQQQIQMMTMDAKYRATVQEQVQAAETEREKMRLGAKREDTMMRTDTQAHDTVIKTQTQIEVEHLKAQVAILLANMDHRQAQLANAETTERAI